MILVEGGTFQMGDKDSDYDDERPVHLVKIASFYIAKFLTTQEIWEAIMGENPSIFKEPRRPVENVSWEDTRAFIRKLNRETGWTLRLPTEAEWEYAARGGLNSQGYVYAGSDKLKQVGWYFENSENETHEVGLLLANELGIYDLSGNILEWCEDDYHENYDDAPEDGTARIDHPERGGRRVLRGGGYFDSPGNCRSANRDYTVPDGRFNSVGFRLALYV